MGVCRFVSQYNRRTEDTYLGTVKCSYLLRTFLLSRLFLFSRRFFVFPYYDLPFICGLYLPQYLLY